MKRSSTEKPSAERRSRRGEGAGGQLSAGEFLALLKRGGVAHANRAEIRGGRPVVARPLTGQSAQVLARLLVELERVAGPAGARVIVRPLLRLGAADLWRPHIGLFPAPRASALAQASASLEARHALLTVLVAATEPPAQHVAGYAAAGVPELWCVSLCSGWTVRFRSPWSGKYQSRTLWYPGEAVPVGALAGAQVEALEAGFQPAERRAGGPDCGAAG